MLEKALGCLERLGGKKEERRNIAREENEEREGYHPRGKEEKEDRHWKGKHTEVLY